MIDVKVVDMTGAAHDVQAQTGESLMAALRDRGFVEGACGGNCACSTCHVHVDANWYAKLPPADSFEKELLRESSHYVADASRLACQITAEYGLSGIQLVVVGPD